MQEKFLAKFDSGALDELIKEEMLSIQDEKVVIHFLDEQLAERSERSKINSRNGAKRNKPQASAKRTPSKKSAKESNIILPWPTKEFASAWDAWKEYKRTQWSFTYKGDSTEQAALTALNTLATDEATAIKIIHQSIANGWKGFFELKQGNNGSSKNGAAEFANSELAKSDPNYKNY